MRIPAGKTARFGLVVVLLLIGHHSLVAYDNQGPHQMINRLALRILWQTYGQNPDLKNYVFKGPAALRPLKGESIVERGDLYEGDQPWLPANVTGLFKIIRSGEKSLNCSEWIEEGGYTAEEPELWQDLRHFYDPAAAPGSPRYLSDFRDWGLWATNNAGRLFSELPQIDAVDWAVEGPARGRFQPNEYSWDRGVDYMRRAFSNAESVDQKDRLFAAAWRALGETLHVLADMTVPAHVRNDSHPGLGLVPGLTDKYGSLKKDPYEAFLDSATIRSEIYDPLFGQRHPTAGLLGQHLDPDLAAQIDAIADMENPSSSDLNIRSLFQAVADITNRNFFSQDTFSGLLQGKVIQPANLMPAYATPRLEDCPEEGGYRVRVFPDGSKVLMGQKDRTSPSGWAVNRAVALSQGGRLIPLALYSGVKLIDWFIPRIKVIIVVDPATKKLKGQVAHIPHGPFTDKAALLYNKPRAWKEGAFLYLDGEKQDPASYSLQVEQGLIDGDLRGLTRLSDGQEHRLELELDMGGIQVRSEPARMTGKSTFRLTGSYIAAVAMASQVLLPRDLGRMVGTTVAWSDYVGDFPIMTVTGALKGIVYLQNRLSPKDQKNSWTYALIIPPDMKPGTYAAEMNYYLDYKGPFSVPISILVAGERTGPAARMSSVAQASLNDFLNDLKAQIGSVTGSLDKEKQLDLARAKSDILAQKTAKKGQLEEDIRGYKKALETAQGQEAEKFRKKLDWATSFLNSMDETYLRLEEDFLQKHEQKIATLQRVKRELENWESAVRAAFRP
jgi:hypothetical protein